jgi:molybdopterin/thiamine biosynthesis adenylyltransferase
MRKATTQSSLSYEMIVQRNYGVMSRQQQDRVRNARVAIVGVGCDGGLAAAILVRMGIGHLTLVDFDTVEASNLNRQPLFGVSDIGRKKVIAASDVLRDYNPRVNIRYVDTRVTEDSNDTLGGHDVVLQCVDNYLARVAVHRVGMALGIPVVSMTGQPPYRAHVSTFMARGPAYEEVFSLPSLGKPLTEKMRKELDRLKWDRARHADQHGATPGWASAFIHRRKGWGGRPVGWGITPERAYITATVQAHEAVRLVTGRRVLAPAPKAIVIDLSHPPRLVTIESPADGKHWDYRKY